MYKQKIAFWLVATLIISLIMGSSAFAVDIFDTSAYKASGACISDTSWHAVGFSSHDAPATLNSITVGIGYQLPESDVQFALWHDAYGQPGAKLTNLGTVAAYDYGTITLETDHYILDANTRYWIVASADADAACAWHVNFADTLPSSQMQTVHRHSNDGGTSWTVERYTAQLSVGIDTLEIVRADQ